MPNVAIVTISGWSENPDLSFVAEHITEWMDITDQEYIILETYLKRTSANRHIIEQMPIEKARKTLAECLELSKKYDESRKKAEEKEALAKEKRLAKLKAKRIEKAKKLLAEAEKDKE